MSATIQVGPGLFGNFRYGLDIGNTPNVLYVGADCGPASNPPSTNIVDIVLANDVLMLALRSWNICVPGNIRRYTLPNSNLSQSVVRMSNPVTGSPEYSASYDETFYASTWHGISSLASILSVGRAPILPSSSGEHVVRHSTFSGSGVFPTVPVYPALTTWSSWTLCGHPGYPVSYNIQVCAGTQSYQGVNKAGYSYYAGTYTYLGSLASALASLSGKTFVRNGALMYTTLNEVYASDEEVRIDADTLIHFNAYSGRPVVEYAVKYRIRCPLPSVDSTLEWLDIGTQYRFKVPETPVFSIISASCTQAYNLTPRSNVVMWYRPILMSPPTSVASPDMSLFPSYKPQSALSSFKSAIDASWKDITPASLFSTTASLRDVEMGTQTDVLQTLFKLPAYRDMVPKIVDAVKILGDIYRRDLSASTIKEILDLASATTLQANFQWRPVSQLVTVELPKISKSVSSLLGGKKIVVGRGSWKFDFLPSTFGRETSQLVVKSKVVLDVSERSLAASLLGFDSLGIFPKASNLWDLIPFSFMVNWFTGVGASLRRAEYGAFLSSIPAYYVHTYSLTSPFSSTELSNWSLTSPSANPLSLKVFYRDVSHFSPLPRDSKFGFGIPTDLPSSGLIGALLYQLLS